MADFPEKAMQPRSHSISERSSDAVSAPSRPRIVSGIAATGTLHIGNFTGAIRQWVQQQDSYESYLFIADLHALTIPEAIRPAEFRRRRREMVALLLACGIDPARSTIFLQSSVSAHAVLGWIFDCVTPVGWLQRMTQYKTKAKLSGASAGLLTYPALQAADILLYQANYVPVGDDQRQHIELARDIAQRFNKLFGEMFTMPEALVPTAGARIMGLDDPAEKMSKSIAEQRGGHAIALLDPVDKIRRTILRAVTDSGTVVRGDDLSPAIANLLVLYESLAGTGRPESLALFEGNGYGFLKRKLVDAALETLLPIQERFKDIWAAPDYVESVLADGALRASRIADRTLDHAKELVGLL